VCGRRSGKTHSAAADTFVITQLRGTPNNCTVIMEPTYDSVRTVAVRAIKEIWPEEFIVKQYNENKHTMTVRTPRGDHEMIFLSATKVDKPRGIPKICFAWCDEVAEYDEETIKNIVIGLADEEAPLLLTTTPKYEAGSIWLKEWRDQALVHAQDSKIDWYDRKYFVQWSMLDNPYLSDRAKKSMADQFSGDWYQQEIMGEFVEGGMMIFDKCHFQTYDWNAINHRNLEFAMTIDPAFTEDDIKQHSQSSITIDGMDSEGNLYFMENPVGFWGIDELIDQIFKYQERYQCRKVGLEKTLAYTAMGKLLEDRMDRERKQFQVIELPLIGNANKVARAQVMVPYIKNGLLKFPTIDGRLTYDADRTIQQFKSFPLGRLNDIVDSNAHMFHRDMGLIEGSGQIDRPEVREVANPIMSKAQYEKFMSNDTADSYSLDPVGWN